MRSFLITLFAIILILAAIAGMAIPTAALYRYYFVPNSSVVPAFAEGTLNLVVEGEHVTMASPPKIIDEEILLPIETVRKYFDPYIWWDEELKVVTITTGNRVIRMRTDNLDALVNNEPIKLNIPAQIDNGVVYIPIDFLSEYYNIEINRVKSNNVIIIDYRNSIREIAEPISSEACVRKGKSIRYPVLKKFNLNTEKQEDNLLRVFETYDGWYKVRTSDGIIGYIESKHVVIKKLLVNELPVRKSYEPEWKPEKGKLNLVWEMTYGKRPEVTKIEGLDVLSPTFFEVINENGDVLNRCDKVYIDRAHALGYQVWALLQNEFKNPDNTEKLLNSTEARDNLIKQLLAYAALYELDGINIDFENVYMRNKDALTQFVREATPLFKEQGLVVSIDVGVPDGSENYSLCYDREAFAEVVDYIMVMTYDQHWATSPVAGSVAQLTWVEKNIKRMLDLVPREKLLLGLPFYVRVWKEGIDENGIFRVTSPGVVTMQRAYELIQENDAQIEWDSVSGQYYAQYKKDEAVYKIWLEDETSINLKSSLVHKYKLAGTASWSKTFETAEVWNVLYRNLKLHENYQEWVVANSDTQNN